MQIIRAYICYADFLKNIQTYKADFLNDIITALCCYFKIKSNKFIYSFK